MPRQGIAVRVGRLEERGDGLAAIVGLAFRKRRQVAVVAVNTGASLTLVTVMVTAVAAEVRLPSLAVKRNDAAPLNSGAGTKL